MVLMMGGDDMETKGQNPGLDQPDLGVEVPGNVEQIESSPYSKLFSLSDNWLATLVQKWRAFWKWVVSVPGSILNWSCGWWRILYCEKTEGINGRAKKAVRFGVAFGMPTVVIGLFCWMNLGFQPIIFLRALFSAYVIGLCTGVFASVFYDKDGNNDCG